MDDRWTLFIMGCTAVLSGLGGAYLIHEHPEGLLVAAWIPYSICALFVAVGGAIVASELDDAFPRRVLVLAFAGAALLAAAWVAVALVLR